MNRAGMLRIAAYGIIGLGAALLIAALLLSTYTSGKIQKIPLNIDESLVSDGTGTALDPASRPASGSSSTRTSHWCPNGRSPSSRPPTPTW